jgi:hypothetical protein
MKFNLMPKIHSDDERFSGNTVPREVSHGVKLMFVIKKNTPFGLAK